jgi:hypothetical protein
VDFKLENVLVSLHSLKTMGIGPFGVSDPLFVRALGSLEAENLFGLFTANSGGFINSCKGYTIALLVCINNDFLASILTDNSSHPVLIAIGISSGRRASLFLLLRSHKGQTI